MLPGNELVVQMKSFLNAEEKLVRALVRSTVQKQIALFPRDIVLLLNLRHLALCL